MANPTKPSFIYDIYDPNALPSEKRVESMFGQLWRETIGFHKPLHSKALLNISGREER